MAIDLLSIPAMAAEPEHLFSGSQLTITDHRNRLPVSSIRDRVSDAMGNEVLIFCKIMYIIQLN
jgi:hypothetical protein